MKAGKNRSSFKASRLNLPDQKEYEANEKIYPKYSKPAQIPKKDAKVNAKK